VDFRVQLGPPDGAGIYAAPLEINGSRDPVFDEDSKTVSFRTLPSDPTDRGTLLLAVTREHVVYIAAVPPAEPPAS